MIVDTSAIVAILRAEPEAVRFSHAIAAAESPRMSVAGYVEAGAVIDAAEDPVASRQLDELIRAAAIEFEPVTVEQAMIARRAYRDFGKGHGHTASLNFGDCLAYALAIDRDDELLFKGDDFGHTDVRCAPW